MKRLTFFAQLSLDFIFGDVKELPKLGEEVLSSTFEIQLGGGTLVYPIILSKLGIDCKVVLKKSDSVHSDLALEMLKKYKIQEIELVGVDSYDTAMSTAVISSRVDRSFVSKNDSRAMEFEDEYIKHQCQGAKVVFVHENNIDIIPDLKEAGSIIVFDIGWSEDLSIEKYREILQYVDYFTPNDKEAIKMTGTTSVEESLQVLSSYVKYPIVSCGKCGCKTIIDGKIVSVKLPEAIDSVDTTGAGDNFMAGLIYGIYHEYDMEGCMKIANCTGALSTMGYGCYGMDYSKEDVFDLYAKYE